jgi:hypothetical protein
MFLKVRYKVCDIGATQIFTRLQGADNDIMKENPNRKMLIDNGWRQSNVISSLAHQGQVW